MLTPIVAMLASLVALGCQRSCADESDRQKPLGPRAVATTPKGQHERPACPTFGGGQDIGRIQAAELLEASGLAPSRKNKDVLWVHNDSGHAPEIFAITTSGRTLAKFGLEGAENVDWEDIVTGPGSEPGESFIYVGDIGSNRAPRDHFVVYRLREPEVRKDQKPIEASLPGAVAMEFTYPENKSYDAETLLLDPQTADLYLVTKDHQGQSGLYLFRPPLETGQSSTLEFVRMLSFPETGERGCNQATSGAISPTGDMILIKTYTRAYVWLRTKGVSINDALATAPCSAPLIQEQQGESVGFSADGRGYFTLSEGSAPPIYFFARQN